MIVAAEVGLLVHEIAPRIAQNPRPRPTLRVGAVGHRKISPDLRPAVEELVHRLLTDIRQAMEEAVSCAPSAGHFTGSAELIVISALAEGSDQLIASAAVQHGYRLGAILPFSIEAYERTFDLADHDASRRTLEELLDTAALPRGFGIFTLYDDNPTQAKDEEFSECGRRVVRFSDLVIAIIDPGRNASFTKDAISYAADRDVPIIAIELSDVPRISFSYGTQRQANDVHTLVHQLMTAASAPVGSFHDENAPSDSIAQYCAEQIRVRPEEEGEPHKNPFGLVKLAPAWICWVAGLNKISSRMVLKVLGADQPEATADTFDNSVELEFDSHTAAPFINLAAAHLRATTLANAYGELYRSTQIAITAVSVAAVVFATFMTARSGWRIALSGAELICVLITLAIMGTAAKQGWLDRWLSYRLLAECLKYSRFLSLTGLPGPSTAGTAYSDFDSDQRRTWVRDHVRFMLRAQPLCVPGCELRVSMQALEKIKSYVDRHCVSDQLAYHQSIAREKRQIADFLRRITFVVSVLSVATVALKFALAFAVPDLSASGIGWLQSVLNVAAALLPAATAALLGFRAFGEHDLIASRSLSVIPKLAEHRARIAAASTLQQVGAHLLAAVDILLAEVDGWLDVFSEKHLE